MQPVASGQPCFEPGAIGPAFYSQPAPERLNSIAKAAQAGLGSSTDGESMSVVGDLHREVRVLGRDADGGLTGARVLENVGQALRHHVISSSLDLRRIPRRSHAGVSLDTNTERHASGDCLDGIDQTSGAEDGRMDSMRHLADVVECALD